MYLAAVICWRPADSSTGNDVIVTFEKISDNVTVYRIDGLQSTNITVLNTERGLVVIDSETSPVFARAIRDEIEKSHPGKKILYLINTHDHGDHTYGNQVFADAVIVGHEKCREKMIENRVRAGQTSARLSGAVKGLTARLETLDKNSDAAAELERAIAYYTSVAAGLGDGFSLTPPEVTFSDSLDLDLGDVHLVLTWFGYSHSPGDIIVFCPEEKLLVTGDIFYENNDLYLDSERIPFMDRWERMLVSVLADTGNIRTIIPGHGDPLPLMLLRDQLAFVREQQTRFAGKTSAFLTFKHTYETAGLTAGIRAMRILHADPAHYYFLHPEFDSYAYRLMNEDKLDDAQEMFTRLAGLFPESYIAFDSLGEVCLKKGDREKAKQYFSRSLELNPDNSNAERKLAQLQ
ncbi:MBL fold metallo-hydrolase [bacterium]|nr:MBL fold metallo-hydrolase [bacterium]